MEEKQQQIDFVKNILLNKIIEKNEDLQNLKLVSAEIKLLEQFNGFMSAILTVDLKMAAKNGVQTEHPIVVKMMKGSVEFRTVSKLDALFSNEIFAYCHLMPELQNFLDKHNIETIDSKEWIPRVYFTDYGLWPELGEGTQAVLVLQNLKPFGYTDGPKLDLNEKHLTMLINTIADYHSVQYAMKISNDPKFDELRSRLMPFLYEIPEGEFDEFGQLFNFAFDRFFEYYDRSPQHHSYHKFNQDIDELRKNFSNNILKLLKKFEDDDPTFNLFVHGDFNRNNILFDYDDPDNFDKLKRLRMIDFQLTRYASPVCDLSFLMYLNMNPDLYDKLWDQLLDQYHLRLIDNITKILQISQSDKLLEKYSKENFLKHFVRFAFFGTMVLIRFVPWMMCKEEESAMIGTLLVKDMEKNEIYDIIKQIGGDLPNERMIKAFNHSCKKGYTDVIYS